MKNYTLHDFAKGRGNKIKSIVVMDGNKCIAKCRHRENGYWELSATGFSWTDPRAQNETCIPGLVNPKMMKVYTYKDAIKIMTELSETGCIK